MQACDREGTCFGLGTGDPAGLGGEALADAVRGEQCVGPARGAVGFISAEVEQENLEKSFPLAPKAARSPIHLATRSGCSSCLSDGFSTPAINQA